MYPLRRFAATGFGRPEIIGFEHLGTQLDPEPTHWEESTIANISTKRPLFYPPVIDDDGVVTYADI